MTESLQRPKTLLAILVGLHVAFSFTQCSHTYFAYGRTDWVTQTPFGAFVDDDQQLSQDGLASPSMVNALLDVADNLGDAINGIAFLEYAVLDVFPNWLTMGARIIGVLALVPIGISLYSSIPSPKFWLILGAVVATLVLIGLVRTDA